ncbi:unnamed protein product [Fusarium graminearum]|uniref:Uncharacterized protein n=2 Tax=Gibberella zeae (strain ATCC MYA-4620 / CBS 123657 / FGSC 9075 / NRRL 31084 / PH-1) TaxID=229533 RepID=A0A098DIS6_GIBZE|nr:unnamed protein product [Fusarium graminearum]
MAILSLYKSTNMEARVSETKKKLLEAGRKAQECKDKAKNVFEEDEFKENQAFQQWAVMNDGAYIGALQAHSANEAMEWQEKKNWVYFQKTHGDDQFEKVFVIILPED